MHIKHWPGWSSRSQRAEQWAILCKAVRSSRPQRRQAVRMPERGKCWEWTATYRRCWTRPRKTGSECDRPEWRQRTTQAPGNMATDQSIEQSTTFYGGLSNSRLINDPVNYTFIGSMAQWLERQSLAGGLSLIYAWSMVDLWPLCG